METLSRNRRLDGRIADEIRAVLSRLGEAKTNAKYVETWHNLILHRPEHRKALESSAVRRGIAVPVLADYDL